MDQKNLSIHMQNYFNSINRQLNEIYTIAQTARKKGYDPTLTVEIPIAKDIADRVEGLIGPKGVGKQIRELENKQLSREAVAFKIAEYICKEKFFHGTKEELAEQAIRTALAIITESITAAPLEGIAKIKIKQNDDNTSYLAVYYAGPIRSAGGTAAGMSVLIADFVRQQLGLDRYKPTQKEIARYLEEIELYNRVSHLQIPTTKEEQKFAAEHIPVEITGEPTDKEEVSGNRDLKRVETNKLRGGACLVFNDGIVGRAKKIYKRVVQNNLVGWDWLQELIKIHEKMGSISEETPEKYDEEEDEGFVESDIGYIKDVIAGRPVFAHPSKKGGFRIRYGRSRNTGLAAMGIHPALMGLTNDFLACGTHLRTERPGKGAIVMPVDTIHPPIVKLKNGSVIKVTSYHFAKQIQDDISEILFLGDMLYGIGEFNQNNYDLIPSGYCEEWWIQELSASVAQYGIVNIAKLVKIDIDRIKEFTHNPQVIPTPDEAIALAMLVDVPLHPEYTYHWHDISVEDFICLREYIKNNGVYDLNNLVIPFHEKIKTILENLCIPHLVENQTISFNEHSKPLLITLGIKNNEMVEIDKTKHKVLDVINSMNIIKVRAKSPVYTGARMGRPEKAKERKMKPPVHLLFPIEEYGGRMRDLLTAASKSNIKIELVRRVCPTCGKYTHESKCHSCNVETKITYFCPKCQKEFSKERCPLCGMRTVSYSSIIFPLGKKIDQIKKHLGTPIPKKIKAVKKLMNKNRIAEPIEKGIIRAQYEVFVYRDGTIRFDSTDAVLTHFKPCEIGISLDKLKQLGYSHDVNGNPLVSTDQIVEIKIQDVILNDYGGDYLVRVANFVDDLLQKVYNLPRFYNISKKSDLIGHLIVGLAPHTSAGIVGRIIGFTKAKVNFAHPYWQAAKRRNCDGDEDSVMLALDAFLNFSKYYLPEIRGGMMDAPLILVSNLNPNEVDDEAHNVDIGRNYPISVYTGSLSRASPKSIVPLIDIVSNRLQDETAYEGFYYTHETSNIFDGPNETMYKKLKKMEEKVEAQLSVAKLIRAVDIEDVAERIIVNHFIPDLIGNLRRFGSQKIRCTACNSTYRRIPLNGICPKCGQNSLKLTVFEKSVTKYLEIANKLVIKYALSDYVKDRLEIIRHNVNALFNHSQNTDGISVIEHEKEKKNKKVRLSDFLFDNGNK
ncbi:MAG: DNA polymerase II large subunit [Candidatus Heimdallarchaeaceae archaeon]